MAKSTQDFAEYAQGKDWGNGGGFESIPDGSYVGVIEKGTVKQSSSGLWGLTVQFNIVESDCDVRPGRKYFNYMPFESKDAGWNPWRVKKFFEDLGLEAPEVSEVVARMNDIADAGMAVSFDLVTRGNYQNMKITAVEEGYVNPTKKDGAKGSKYTEQNVKQSREAKRETEKEESKEESASAKPKKTMKKAAESTDEEDDNAKEALIEFGAAAGISIDDSMSLQEIKDEIGQYELDESELTKSEIALLEDNGLGSIIKRKAKKK